VNYIYLLGEKFIYESYVANLYLFYFILIGKVC